MAENNASGGASLTGFKVLSFDCYGTLIDWESGILTALAPLTERLAQCSSGGRQPTRDELLERHAQFESAQQKQTPAMRYSALLAVVYRRLAEFFGIAVPWAECVTYGNSVKDWPAFADSHDSLAYLKQFYQLVILSNVDNTSFAASNEKLGVTFDAIYTAEDIGGYKPRDDNFQYMLARLGERGIAPAHILHTAESLFHDHEPANRFGLTSCRIYRRHARQGFGAAMPPQDTPHYDFCFNSMAQLVEAHRAAVSA